MDTVCSASFSVAWAEKEIVLAHAASKGAMLESMSDATHVLPGKDGDQTGALLYS
jgi:hypothetical protein